MAKKDFYLHNFKTPLKTEFNDAFNTRYFADDPLYASFSVFFDIDSPLLNHAENTSEESAERYFMNNNDYLRADYIRELRQRIGELVFKHQYFLKNIKGLNKLYSKKIGDDEIELTMETFESLDMRITKIKELISLVTYDYDNENEVLPDNLQWLNVNILISDFRRIGKVINGEIIDITPSLDTTIFTIKHCAFDVEGGNDYFEDINNSEPKEATNSLKIIGGHSHMKKNRIGLLQALTNDVGSSMAAVRTSLRTGVVDMDEEKLKKIESIKNENENDKKIQHKVNLGDIAKKVGGKVIKDASNALQREINDKVTEMLSSLKSKSGLNNVFFRGGFAESINSGDTFGALKSAIGGGALPKLDANIAELILNGKKLTKEQSNILISEIIQVTTKNLGNVFER